MCLHNVIGVGMLHAASLDYWLLILSGVRASENAYYFAGVLFSVMYVSAV